MKYLILALMASNSFATEFAFDTHMDDWNFLPQLEQRFYYNIPKVPQNLTFNKNCLKGQNIVIGAVGDVLLHSPLQKQAVNSPLRFGSLWNDIAPLFKKTDFNYANFEGPAAGNTNSSGQLVLPDPGFIFDERAYTSYPMFNYHEYLIPDLKALGVGIVSTSNNHSLDRRSIGVDRTIKHMNKYSMPFVGTFLKDSEKVSIYKVVTVKGIRLGFIACTYGTNGMPDYYNQVVDCYKDTKLISDTISLIKKYKLADAVIVTPHWGAEYVHKPSKKEIDLAHTFLNAGAVAIIGAHPHVLQPFEKFVTTDGRETFIIYSLGNFVSGQKPLPRRSTIFLNLGLTKLENGSVIVNGFKYVPLEMHWDTSIHLGEPTPEVLTHIQSVMGADGSMKMDEVLKISACLI